MAAAESVLHFIQQVNTQDSLIVRDHPKFDLELYIQNYRGRTVFDRLFLIGRTCVPLCVDALKASVAEAKSGKDVSQYRDACEALRLAAPTDPDALFDKAWVEQMERSNKLETQRLEAELKVYRNNLVKESIRMGNEDLGRHLESIGELRNAVDAFNRMRPEICQPKHLVEVGKHVVRVALQLRDWNVAMSNLNKISGLQAADEDKDTLSWITIARGMMYLGMENYEEAAASFLQADPNLSSAEYNTIISPNDIAVYGGLTALVTMDRDKLQTQVLDNQTFRTFLELESHIRKAISAFVNGRYTVCLSILESYRPDYLLDLHLQRHISAMFLRIRMKCIMHYFRPFSCVTLDSLNEAFGQPSKSIEEELHSMISLGYLNARINRVDGLLTAVSPDVRVRMQKDVLEKAKAYEKEALERIRRIGLAAADLDARGKKAGHPDLFDEPDDTRTNTNAPTGEGPSAGIMA